MSNEKRRAARIVLNVPTVVEPIGQPQQKLHEALAAVYDRVTPDDSQMGERFPGILHDLSTNGAFITGDSLPLLTRVAFTFPLTGYGQVDALGWILWRRTDDCVIPRDSGEDIKLAKGFGVLFEAIPLDARVAIHELVNSTAG